MAEMATRGRGASRVGACRGPKPRSEATRGEAAGHHGRQVPTNGEAPRGRTPRAGYFGGSLATMVSTRSRAALTFEAASGLLASLRA